MCHGRLWTNCGKKYCFSIPHTADFEIDLLKAYAAKHGLECKKEKILLGTISTDCIQSNLAKKASFLRRCPAWSLDTICHLTWERSRSGRVQAAVKITAASLSP